MNLKRVLTVLLTVAMLTALLAGCSKQTDGSDTSNPGTTDPGATESATTEPGTAESGTTEPTGATGEITMLMKSIGNNMDPIIANYADTSAIMNHVYDNMLTIDHEFNIQPGVASSWDTPDNLTYVLTIGEGFKFHNGAELTMDDVRFSFERYADIPERAEIWSRVDSISVDGRKLIVKLKEPYSDFIRNFVATPVLNKAYCEAAGEKYANEPIGTGPYKVKSYIPGTIVELEAWEDYPFEKASIKTIKFKPSSDNAAAFMALEAGDAQIIRTDFNDFGRAQENDKFATYEGESSYTAFVAMNTTAAPFDNVNVRKAMAYAYNKEGYLKISGGGQFVIDSMFPAQTPYYYKTSNTITYNLDEAKRLLEAEGYNESNPLEFVIAGYQGEDPIIQAYQADLNKIGVKVTLESYEFGTFLNMMMNCEYQMLSGGWGDTTGGSLSAAACYSTTSYGSQNIAFFNNAHAEELYQKAVASSDEKETIEVCKELQVIAWDEVPMFPTFGRYSYYAFDKKLTGVDFPVTGLISFRTAKFE